jgi:hypothetical protein
VSWGTLEETTENPVWNMMGNTMGTGPQKEKQKNNSTSPPPKKPKRKKI